MIGVFNENIEYIHTACFTTPRTFITVQDRKIFFQKYAFVIEKMMKQNGALSLHLNHFFKCKKWAIFSKMTKRVF